MDEDRELRPKVIRKLARRRVVGGHKKQVDTVKNWFATDEQGRVEDLIRDMIRDPNAPLEGYGGSRDNVRLTSLRDAKRYIEERGGELPWGLRDGWTELEQTDERSTRVEYVRSPRAAVLLEISS